MKIKLLSIIILCFGLLNSTKAYSRKDTTIVYCNINLEKVNKKYAQYYAKIYKNKDGSTGVKHYTRYNLLHMTGEFKDDKLKIKEGVFAYYDHKGILQREGEYKNNNKNGVWRYFAPNGKILGEGEYIDDLRSGKWIYHDDKGNKTSTSNFKNGELDGEVLKWFNTTLILQGEYEKGNKNGNWQAWYENGKVDYKGKYISGNREGEWRFYFESGNLAAKEQYVNGKAVKVEWFNEQGNEVVPIEPLEVSPEFPGGEKAMQAHLRTFNYPEEAKMNGEQGVVYVSFVVNQNGTLTGFEVVKGVSPSIDEEALRVLKSMPNWLPGNDHNRTKSTIYTIPISCRLG